MTMALRMSGIARRVSARVGAGAWPGAVIDTSGATFDNGGSITAPGVVTERDCFVQVDEATSAMRAAEGYVEGDVRLLVLAGSLSGPLTPDARVRVDAGPHAGLYSVRSALLDVAATHWDCRGRPEITVLPAPSDYEPAFRFNDARNSQYLPLAGF